VGAWSFKQEAILPKQLPQKVLKEITTIKLSAKRAQALIQVYAEAEIIRVANIEANIALEDIVQALIDHSANGPGCEVNPDEARDALLGVTFPPATLH
jgi:hypothetical protein